MRKEQREGREPEPIQRKRRKKKVEAPSRGFLIAIIVGSSVLGVLVVIGLAVFLIVKLSGGKLKAPESFAVHKAPEQLFQCEYPSGWDVKSSGIKNSYSVTFEKSSASITISESIRSSALGDIANAGPEIDPNDDARSPVARVHAIKKKDMELEFNKYEEGQPTFVATGFGKVARSPFTASEVFGPKLRGYRATVLAGMTGLDVICQCKEGDWEMLRPAFERLIASLKRGTGE